MNILPQKKWHVRTKENIARVRRDEAKAAQEEQDRLDRAIKAENERRLEALRAQAAKREANLEPFSLRGSSDATIASSSGHVNLFQDLEQAELQNFGHGNKEYEEEKRKEQAEWDSKMGIQKAFAEGTKELNKEQEWYTKITRPIVRQEEVKGKITSLPSTSLSSGKEEAKDEKKHKKKKRKRSSSSESGRSSDSKKRRKKQKREKKKGHHHHRHHHHDHESNDNDNEKLEMEIEKRNRLAALREERLIRERAEVSTC
ncbi:unnamed protein product [Strongylus vulgaris]|uniref:CBF1-interacting co-repressor CIR N-terminal domain-containing protein n=1 Tax=Strongylus vulgaris TaxID=40348 RepID=A0A3P7KEB6_STRVU|nr:unnamed protein product [Strongylus vulgaris]